MENKPGKNIWHIFFLCCSSNNLCLVSMDSRLFILLASHPSLISGVGRTDIFFQGYTKDSSLPHDSNPQHCYCRQPAPPCHSQESSEAILSPGLFGVALKHLETHEVQDILSLPSISRMSCWRIAIVSFYQNISDKTPSSLPGGITPCHIMSSNLSAEVKLFPCPIPQLLVEPNLS